jgi:NAD(P)-dependent dehydrogenase (short-subunit alcohol dehydrogenase family)
VRSGEKAETVQRAAQAAGLQVDTVLLDVTDAAQCEDVIARARPYGLVNNAAMSAIGALEDVDDDEARLMLETMVIGPTRLTRLALPHMKAQGCGRIVNMSSIYGLLTTPLSGWYQASKHALEALSDALRVEVASAGVAVIVVQPGGYRTGMWDSVVADTRRRRDTSYGEAYERLRIGIRRGDSLLRSPDAVSRVVARAMTARSPRPLYRVGYDAHLLSLMQRLLPTSIKDGITRRLVRL